MSDSVQPPNNDNRYLGLDDATQAGGHLLHNLMLFGRVCRVLGMDVTPNRMMDVARALEFIDIWHKRDFYNTLRALIATHPRDYALFDEAFDLFWQRPVNDSNTLDLDSIGGDETPKPRTQFLPPSKTAPGEDESQSQAKPSIIAVVPTVSLHETLRHKDFAEMTGPELAQAQSIIAQLPKTLSFRRSRRYRPGKGDLLDMRRSFRRSLRTGGDIFDFPRRHRRVKPRPMVIIADISGSMERYTRVLLHFMHTLASTMFQVESFVFSTRLTRITHPIRQRSVDSALRDVGQNVNDWGGGTNTGAAIKRFNYHWARRVLGQGAVVMIITDGWDRGDPDLLRKEMKRLQRSCYRLIWLNPLLDIADYEPLTRGAQAMLPAVDDFLPIRNLANLERLVTELQRIDWKRRR